MTRSFPLPCLPAALLVLLALPVTAQEAAPAPEPAGAASPPSVADAVARGLRILVDRQENYVEERQAHYRDPERQAKWQAEEEARRKKARAAAGAPAEWPYEGVYRVRGKGGAQIPLGYRVGGTAISCWALAEAPGFLKDPARRKAVGRAVEFMLRELEGNPLLDGKSHGAYDVRGWAHAYALLFFMRGMDAGVFDEKTTPRVRKVAAQLVKAIEDLEIRNRGGWNYSRTGGRDDSSPSTFMTAATLQALFQARAGGLEVDAGVVKRALSALRAGRVEESGAYQYATDPRRKTGQAFEAVAGACARMAIVESTLTLAGEGSEARLAAAVDAFFENWKWLEQRRRQTGTHVPPYGIAPYYFHFGHTYVAQAIELLPAKRRPPLRKKLQEVYWRTREEDGSWNDRIPDRSAAYGTAMAVLGLAFPDLKPVPAWKPE